MTSHFDFRTSIFGGNNEARAYTIEICRNQVFIRTTFEGRVSSKEVIQEPVQ